MKNLDVKGDDDFTSHEFLSHRLGMSGTSEGNLIYLALTHFSPLKESFIAAESFLCVLHIDQSVALCMYCQLKYWLKTSVPTLSHIKSVPSFFAAPCLYQSVLLAAIQHTGLCLIDLPSSTESVCLSVCAPSCSLTAQMETGKLSSATPTTRQHIGPFLSDLTESDFKHLNIHLSEGLRNRGQEVEPRS